MCQKNIVTSDQRRMSVRNRRPEIEFQGDWREVFRKTGSHGTRTPRVLSLRFSNQYADEEENCCFRNATLSPAIRNVTDRVVLIGSKGARERKANRV